MSSFENIINLETFRECKDETIPRKTMGKVLEAGRQAPSPKNIQSMEFIVVEDDEKLEMLANAVGDHRVKEAPTTVVIVSDLERMGRKLGEDQARSACIAEASMAAQNMRIVARENGISSIWVSGFNEEVVSDQFNVPGGKLAVGVVSFAYTDEPSRKKPKFRMNEMTYYDEYGNQIASVFDGVEWKGLYEEKRIYGKKSKGVLDKARRRLSKLL
ncbi:MAG: nitroreductase family protein [Candidatus Nanohaloarchaea archaeon]